MKNDDFSRTDAELLRRSRRDIDAFVVVCDRHVGQLRGWLRRELRDGSLADELLAETFAEAWFAHRRFRDPGDGNAGAWLHGIARHLVLRLRRDRTIESRGRARLGLPIADPDAFAEVIDRLDAVSGYERLRSPINGLPADQREALELRVVEGLDYREVGERLTISPQAARVRVFRALRSIRSQIGAKP